MDIKTAGTILRGICELLEGLTNEHIGLRVHRWSLTIQAILSLANNLASQIRGVSDALTQRSPARIRLHNRANAEVLDPSINFFMNSLSGRVSRPDLVVFVPGVLCGGVDGACT